jgi:hypothetical protein
MRMWSGFVWLRTRINGELLSTHSIKGMELNVFLIVYFGYTDKNPPHDW